MICSATASLHDGLDPRPVRLGLSRELRIMCDGCRRRTAGMGVVVRIVERRDADVAIALDRRRFVPAWLRNLTARDETGRAIA